MFLQNRARPVRKADNLTAMCEPIGSLTSHNPTGLHGVTGIALLTSYPVGTGGKEAGA
jgi:hypothetical protein